MSLAAALRGRRRYRSAWRRSHRERHLAYVGMTRHRETATLYAGCDDFQDEKALARRLSRARPKLSSFDFAERRGSRR